MLGTVEAINKFEVWHKACWRGSCTGKTSSVFLLTGKKGLCVDNLLNACQAPHGRWTVHCDQRFRVSAFPLLFIRSLRLC